jgi:hypothetical protein
MTQQRVAFALAGLGGNNAYGAGFLSAAQQVQIDRNEAATGGGGTPGEPLDDVRAERARRKIMPELEFISCTSGAIATTAEYLRGDNLQTELQTRIAGVDKVVNLPHTEWAQPWRAPVVALFTGVPNVFGPWQEAFTQHLWRRWTEMLTPTGLAGPVAPTLNDMLDLWLPAQSFVPKLPAAFFEQTAATFNDASHGVGVAFNSFDPTTGREHLYVNKAGLELIRQHHDSDARYGMNSDRIVYQPITPEGVRNALWLFSYGFPSDKPGVGQHVDGCYVRSIILDELTFADRIYAVKPINHRWIGRLPQNALETQDMQTELWMGISYREQARLIDTFNRLLEKGRLQDPHADPSAPASDTGNKRYHPIELIPVEIGMQRGFFTYFIEDFEVFREACAQTLEVFDNHRPASALAAAEAAQDRG